MECIDIVVLGAGISGLSYAKTKRKLAPENTLAVFDENDYYGGLCHSFKIDGFTFDSAVHLSFTKIPDVMQEFEKTKLIKHFPVAYNFYNGYWLKHPLIFNLYPFTLEKKIEYISDFVSRSTNIDINTYADWLKASYGEKIKKDFFDVYTQKYWTVDAEKLSTTWIGNRISCPSLEKILFGAFSPITGNDYYANEMRYPEKGGYQSFLRDLAENIDIRLCKRVVSLNTTQQTVSFSDKTTVQYRKLASSIPLNELVQMTEDAPDAVKMVASELECGRISIVSVGLRKEKVFDKLWFYVYDKDIYAARINCPGVKSPNNVPHGCSSLQFEIYHRGTGSIDKEDIIKNVRYAIKKMHLAEEDEILFTDYRLLKNGNVLFYTGMEDKRQVIYDYYASKNISLLGRFGRWDYLWSDQAYMSGKTEAEKDV